MKKLSLLNLCDLLLLPLLFVFYLLLKWQIKGGWFITWFLSYLLILAISTRFDSRVFNNCDFDLSCKSEEGSDIIVVKSGECIKGVDGVKYKGVVYKIPDGITVSFDSKGIHHYSLCGWLIFRIMGRSFDGWNDLFCK